MKTSFPLAANLSHFNVLDPKDHYMHISKTILQWNRKLKVFIGSSTAIAILLLMTAIASAQDAAAPPAVDAAPATDAVDPNSPDLAQQSALTSSSADGEAG